MRATSLPGTYESKGIEMRIHQTAQFEVKEDQLGECVAAIEEFIAYVRDNEAGTLLYTSLQQKDDPAQFIHYFIFQDEAARDIHANSEAVEHFTDILYPRLIAPVVFTEYSVLASTQSTP
jgi:quinol monooxygenase YgiN